MRINVVLSVTCLLCISHIAGCASLSPVDAKTRKEDSSVAPFLSQKGRGEAKSDSRPVTASLKVGQYCRLTINNTESAEVAPMGNYPKQSIVGGLVISVDDDSIILDEVVAMDEVSPTGDAARRFVPSKILKKSRPSVTIRPIPGEHRIPVASLQAAEYLDPLAWVTLCNHAKQLRPAIDFPVNDSPDQQTDAGSAESPTGSVTLGN